MSSKPHVYIVLVNWNGAADTLECLESALRLDYPSFELIVCDNASSDRSVEAIEAWASGAAPEVRAANRRLAELVEPNLPKPVALTVLTREQAEAGPTIGPQHRRLTVIRTGGNLGFAGGNNVGIRYAQACGQLGYVWLLNNDTVVEPGALSALVERAQAAQDMGIVGSTLVFYHQMQSLQAMGGARLMPARALSVPLGCFKEPKSAATVDATRIEAELSYVVGASMLVPAKFLAQVGLMSEDYFLYFEELDWAVRGARHGFKCLYAPASMVYHKVGASTERKKSGRLTATTRYAYLNRLKFTSKYFESKLSRVRLRIFLEGARELIHGNTAEGVYAVKLALTPLSRLPNPAAL